MQLSEKNKYAEYSYYFHINQHVDRVENDTISIIVILW